MTRELAKVSSVDDMVALLGPGLGEFLGLSAIVFVQLEPDGDAATATHAWQRPGIPSVLGTGRISAFLSAEFHNTLRAGRLFVVENTGSDPRVQAAPYEALQIRAFVAVPLVQDGQWKFFLSIHDAQPRRWVEEELELIRQLTELVWQRLERLRAESERRATDRRLRRSEETSRTQLAELESIYRHAPCGLCVLDRDLRFVRINEAMAALNGLPVADHLGRTVREVIPNIADVAEPQLRKVFETGQPQLNMELTGETPAQPGVVRSWREHWFPQKDAEGVTHFINIVAEEITAQKHAAEVLDRVTRESAQRSRLYDTILSSTPDLVYVFDRNHRFTYANKALLAMWGKPWDEAIGRTCLELGYEPWHAAMHDREIEQVIATRQPIRGEVPFNGTNGRRIYDYIFVPVIGGDGEVEAVAGTTRDVTDRHESETALKESEIRLGRLNQDLERIVAARTEELRRKEAELSQAQKLEAIGRLAGGVAHDFNNMITGVLGIVNELLEDPQRPALERQDLEAASAALYRASGLTRQLLAFGRRQVYTPKVLSLNQMVTEMTQMFRRLITEDIRMRTSLEPALGHISVDPTALEQVILNLVLNARDAMPKGGTLTIETANRPWGDDERPHVLLSVRDTGIGMTQDMLSHIFEPFYTTKERTKGSGLGLPTVYGIVKQAGGDVEVDSEPNEGTTFRVYFPCVAKEAEPAPATRPAAGAGGDEKILVVEDEDIVRRVAVRALRKVGYDVYEARNAQEAKALLLEVPSLDLLLTDVIMPGLNGHELATQLQADRPDLPVLYMSGYSEAIIARKGLLKEGITFIEKSFTADSLRRKVREVLDAVARA